MKLKIVSDFIPKGDQPQAINNLSFGLEHNLKHQVLLGVTGSGKTFTIAKVIEKVQRPTLIISHNKTLAAQLYQEFRDFFSHNAVSYFVSYYDFYQPEAYIPQTDTYIEKEAEINENIDKLRLAATTNILTRKDTIIVASVSCIYNIGSPKEYGSFILELKIGVKLKRESIISRMVSLQYQRDDFEFKRGTFRIRGDVVDIFPAYTDQAVRITNEQDVIKDISIIDPITGEVIENPKQLIIYPAKHYMTDSSKNKQIFINIREDLRKQVTFLKKNSHPFEAHRLEKKVNYDLEMIQEIGYVNGIENYSRYFDGRKEGEAPFTLLDYFSEAYRNNWLIVVDESHMTIPQLNGMYNGDRSRKQTLIDYGFRLPAALDNRPLMFTEFMQRVPNIIYISATPNNWEISLAREASKSCSCGYNHPSVAEQLIRPTGIIDPEVIIRPTSGQIIDLIKEIIIRKKRKERVLVTTLTKKIAEDLADYLNEKKYLSINVFNKLKSTDQPLVHYLHSDIITLERSNILDDLRNGKYDVIIGINLLREGLDLPEVSLVAILDADKEGFLRSKTSLIQTMGRAARHIQGKVIMYADVLTDSMKNALTEIDRRRHVQLEYNRNHKQIPQPIVKPIRDKLIEQESPSDNLFFFDTKKRIEYRKLLAMNFSEFTPYEKKRLIKKMEKEMKEAANNLNFELAIEIRNRIKEISLD